MNSTLEKDDLKSAYISTERLREYLIEKANGHNHFKVYTRFDRLTYWISSRAIYLSDGKCWNDVHDRESFNNPHNGIVNFGTCFSFSESENVAMWMLYGGTNSDGVMVDFQRKHIAKILNDTPSIEIGYWNNDEFVPQKTITKDAFSIMLSDVLYYAENSEKAGTYDIKRSNESIKGTGTDSIDKLECVKKSYAWNYENECRLILSLDRSIIPVGAYAIKIDVGDTFSELMKAHRIYEAPNYKSSYRFSKSKLRGEIDWDLCHNCQIKKHTCKKEN